MSIKITKHIPNFLTLSNAFLGSLATMMAFDGRIQIASYLILAAAVLDFSDGFFARLLKAYSELGKQLDSLADLISFGLAPAAIAQQLIASSIFAKYSSHVSPELIQYISWAAFLLVVFSALRLAKFNIDTRQTTSFIGLPTPANAMFWVGITFFPDGSLNEIFTLINSFPSVWLIFVVVFSLLLIAPIPMFSLKLKTFSLRENLSAVILLLASVLLIIFFKLSSLSLIIVFYILLSIIFPKIFKQNTQ